MTAVSELIGAELDAAVARLEHQNFVIEQVTMTSMPDYGMPLHVYVDELRCLRIYKSFDGTERGGFWLGYSTHWELAGPIIERERIMVYPAIDFPERDDIPVLLHWCAVVEPRKVGQSRKGFIGPTPLVAAMRAYVASKGTP